MHSAANYSVPQDPGTPIPAPRRRRTSQTISSAFSTYASPNEDWTKISDFGERRRLQSRIAQRNYRMKQKQQPEKQIESSLPTPESTHEELDISISTPPRSVSDLSHINSQQQEVQNFYDVSTPESLQRQCLPLNDDYVMPLHQFTPQLLAPRAHDSTSGSPLYLSHANDPQQPTDNFDNSCTSKAPQQQRSPLSNNCVMPSYQYTPQLLTPQPLCAHTSTSGSASYLSHSSGPQQPIYNFDNNYMPKPLQQQCPPLSDNYIVPLQQFVPQLLTPQPACAHMSTSGSASYLSHTSGPQQPTNSFNNNYISKPLQQRFSVSSNNCVIPLQQSTPQVFTPQLPCAHASTSGSASCLFHTSGQQQPTNNFGNSCAPRVPRQQCPLLSDNYIVPLQQFTRQFSTSQPSCACKPTSGPALCHPQPGGQQQRMYSFYDRALPRASRAGSEDYTRTSFGQFEPSCGAPAIDLSSSFVFPPHPSSPYMALPLPPKGCYCHHNHSYQPAIGHAVPVDILDMHATYLYQDTALDRIPVDFS